MTTSDTTARHALVAVNSTADAVVTVDAKGTITSWNPAAQSIFGYRPDQAIGQSLALIVPEAHRPRHVAAFHAAMTSGALSNNGAPAHVEGTTANGSLIQLHMTLGLTGSADAPPDGVVAVLRPDGHDVSFI